MSDIDKKNKKAKFTKTQWIGIVVSSIVVIGLIITGIVILLPKNTAVPVPVIDNVVPVIDNVVPKFSDWSDPEKGCGIEEITRTCDAGIGKCQSDIFGQATSRMLPQKSCYPDTIDTIWTKKITIYVNGTIGLLINNIVFRDVDGNELTKSDSSVIVTAEVQKNINGQTNDPNGMMVDDWNKITSVGTQGTATITFNEPQSISSIELQTDGSWHSYITDLYNGELKIEITRLDDTVFDMGVSPTHSGTKPIESDGSTKPYYYVKMWINKVVPHLSPNPNNPNNGTQYYYLKNVYGYLGSFNSNSGQWFPVTDDTQAVNNTYSKDDINLGLSPTSIAKDSGTTKSHRWLFSKSPEKINGVISDPDSITISLQERHDISPPQSHISVKPEPPTSDIKYTNWAQGILSLNSDVTELYLNPTISQWKIINNNNGTISFKSKSSDRYLSNWRIDNTISRETVVVIAPGNPLTDAHIQWTLEKI
jgi:hypothetical protein